MIRVKVKEEKRHITSIMVKGHAQSAEYGKDLICAAVSTAITGIINELERRKAFEKGQAYYQLEEGYATIDVNKFDHDIQVVLETFVTIMATIENTYPEYLLVEKEVK